MTGKRLRVTRCSLVTLEIEKELLPPEAAAIPAKLAILPYDPMAGDNDCDSVVAVRLSDGALGAWSPHVTSLLFVADGDTVRYSL